MKILAIRTDKPEAKLYIYEGTKQLDVARWQAHRELAETVHTRTLEILNKSSISLNDLEGIVCFRGPGSFTGLRIGLSVANALAYAASVPVVARGGDDWLLSGIDDLIAGKDDKITVPEYGAPARTTPPKK